jgi:hypothetical protein
MVTGIIFNIFIFTYLYDAVGEYTLLIKYALGDGDAALSKSDDFFPLKSKII